MFKTLFLVLCAILSGCSAPTLHIPPTHSIKQEGAKSAIIFIHGLNGDPIETWKNPETGGEWTKLLSKDPSFSEFEIYSISYNASLLSGNLDLSEMGRWLRSDLRSSKIIGSGKFSDLYFIAHSMGNLALRSAIYESPEFFSSVRIPLIISMGSPSLGSELATIGRLVMPGNAALDNLATKGNPYLAKINSEWQRAQGDTRISCGYETLPTSGVGMVVPRASATAICNGELWPIPANHSFMVKPRNESDRIYTWIRDEIIETKNSAQLKSKINFKNIYTRATENTPKTQPLETQTAKAQQSIQVKDLKAAIPTMYSSSVTGFLRKMVPKIEGGISCNDLIDLVNAGYSSDAAKTIIYLAKYVKRPLDNGCISRAGNASYSGEAQSAIEALLAPQ